MLNRATIQVMVGISMLLAACAGTGTHTPRLPAEEISVPMLVDEGPLARGHDFEDLPVAEVLALTPAMKTFVDERMQPHFGPKARLRALTYAIMNEGVFEIVYDETTLTAAETFAAQRGNCMSFTNLFVAMARYASLDARFQEVDVPPMWSFAGDSFVINRHINVSVDLGHNSTRVIDFNINDFTSEYESRVVSDRRALAHFFNNLGAEAMLDGDTLAALGNFRQSIREDGTFAPTWVNLGSLYRRDGYLEYAEAAYLQALKGDESNLVAMSNLASLYRQTGRNELADRYARLVRVHRDRNPYYHYFLATAAIDGGDYAKAIGRLRQAIKLRDDEPRFYSLLSISYLMSGNRAEALRWMEEAEAVAVEAAEKDHYHQKLEVLMSHNGTH